MLFTFVSALPQGSAVPRDGSLPAQPGYIYVECNGPNGPFGEMWSTQNMQAASIAKVDSNIQFKSSLNYKPGDWKARMQFNNVNGDGSPFVFGAWDIQVPFGFYVFGNPSGTIVDSRDNLQWKLYTTNAPTQTAGQYSCTPRFFAIDQPESLPTQETLPSGPGYVLMHCYNPDFGASHEIWSSSDMSQIQLCADGQCNVEHKTQLSRVVNWEVTPSVNGVPDAVTGQTHGQWNFQIIQLGLGNNPPSLIKEPGTGRTWQLNALRYAAPLQGGGYECLPSYYARA
ncbi:hypothetical protein EDD86DRAFT_247951 [Gorgonomyces haynaldii]|nr:hypothetical protein EDD86DRAFT_247951 [Gorgonomyces haynaldii]